jgi:hypothetical protein
VADLALAPPRAALAATVDDEIHVPPISLSVKDPTDLDSSPRIVRVPEDAPGLADRNVLVISDDGPQWFRLRSLSVRGTAIAIGDHSYRMTPKRVVARDYGSLRYVPTPPESAGPPEPLFDGADCVDIHPPQSANLAAALSTCRVMILATRSGRGTPLRGTAVIRFRTVAGSGQPPRLRRGRYVMSSPLPTWPSCLAARPDTTATGCSPAVVPTPFMARHPQRCSLVSSGATTWIRDLRRRSSVTYGNGACGCSITRSHGQRM